jgi:predicted transcriptional regulator YheO
MTKEEKVGLVASLNYEGAFLIKGSVGFVAKAMGVSIYTVYNYLKEIRSSINGTDVIM